MYAEPWGDRPAFEAHQPIESPGNPREREGGEGERRAAARDGGPSRGAGRGGRPGEGPGGHVRLETEGRRESDQARAHGGRREAVPEPVPPRVPARGSAPVVGRLQGRNAETPGQAVIHDLRRIESFAPHRFSSMSTPTSVAANDPSLRPASFKILRRCSSPSNPSRA